ncbi:MAG: formate--tetrahydrofolate ligase [Clostridiales bacterium]|nr:formate--tetrahydrofolate ligase [Clostridiales bacterium]
MTDLEIARVAGMRPIAEIARSANIPDGMLETYGRYRAKVDPKLLDAPGEHGRLVLVTAISPTPAGEGKTTTTIGLADGLKRIGKRPVVALREPSLGPVFGVKGGAAGGGWAQVVPMEEINLHFNGDFHAIAAANNLLAAMIDNHIHQGNALGIDSRRVVWRRCMDMNDRQLRLVVDGLGGKANGMPREDGFDITAASEVMATLCMAAGMADLKERLSRIVVAYDIGDQPVTAGQLRAQGAMAALLKDAIKPNLAQTLGGVPALIHGGPFANIAHGCNSVLATRLAMKLGDYAVTEAGFGADLGAEKFLDIVCRSAGFAPSAAVLVATVRALKAHGGAKKAEWAGPAPEALKAGVANLRRHVDNLKNVFRVNCVVAINRFPTDTDEEIELVRASCEELGVAVVESDVWAKGGEGGEALAREVVRLCEGEVLPPAHPYQLSDSLRAKIASVVEKVYRGRRADFTADAEKQLRALTKLGYGKLPVCIAKTQYSFSDNPSLLGAPEGFAVTVRSVKVSAGAGFVVALTGDIMTMPGLPKVPAAEAIDVDDEGNIMGLF